MGGQACVFYGAAEFSRDVDLLILIDPDNLARVRAALGDLNAVPIAVPQFDPDLLNRRHAVHFRCRREDFAGLRIDLMSDQASGGAELPYPNHRSIHRSRRVLAAGVAYTGITFRGGR
jgi:hypothetical protein